MTYAHKQVPAKANDFDCEERDGAVFCENINVYFAGPSTSLSWEGPSTPTDSHLSNR